MEESKFLIITGMSGAGKTQAIRTLEDMNYFCVDNMPPALITKFAELSRQASAPRNTAIVVDIRGGRFFDKLAEVLDELRLNGYSYEVLFLDASDAVLIRRYKETRRRHPLGQGRTSASAPSLRRVSGSTSRASLARGISTLSPFSSWGARASASSSAL